MATQILCQSRCETLTMRRVEQNSCFLINKMRTLLNRFRRRTLSVCQKFWIETFRCRESSEKQKKNLIRYLGWRGFINLFFLFCIFQFRIMNTLLSRFRKLRKFSSNQVEKLSLCGMSTSHYEWFLSKSEKKQQQHFIQGLL